MDSSQQLGQLLQSLADKAPDALDNDARALLADAAARYPYFAVPALALLRDGRTENDTDALRQRLALTASSQRTLAFAAYGDKWRDFYPAAAEPQPQDTTDVIDTFLRTYGSCTPEEEALIEKMIFNPAPDYAEMLAREEQENLPEAPTDAPDSPDARIAAFILREHPAAHKEEEPEPQADEESEKSPIPRPEHSDDSLLSESLARPSYLRFATVPTTLSQSMGDIPIPGLFVVILSSENISPASICLFATILLRTTAILSFSERVGFFSISPTAISMFRIACTIAFNPSGSRLAL